MLGLPQYRVPTMTLVCTVQRVSGRQGCWKAKGPMDTELITALIFLDNILLHLQWLKPQIITAARDVMSSWKLRSLTQSTLGLRMAGPGSGSVSPLETHKGPSDAL